MPKPNSPQADATPPVVPETTATAPETNEAPPVETPVPAAPSVYPLSLFKKQDGNLCGYAVHNADEEKAARASGYTTSKELFGE